MKKEIERFSSQRDLSNLSAPIHHDIDLSEEGRPTLKLDVEASTRHKSNTEANSQRMEVEAAERSIKEQEQKQQRFLLEQVGGGLKVNKERADSLSDGEEIVAPYEEDKVSLGHHFLL